MKLVSKITPFQHQVDCFNKHKDASCHALFWQMGCLSGDTVLRINRGGISRKYTIKNVYEKLILNLGKRWNKAIKTKTRSYQDGFIKLNDIVQVYYSGKKQLYKLTLKNGFELKATFEHKILTKQGWFKLIDLKPEDEVMVDVLKKHQKKNKKKEKTKLLYKVKVVGKFYPYSNIHKSKRRKDQYTVGEHRVVYDAFLNNMAIDEFIRQTHTNSNLLYTDIKQFHVHHIDFNHRNNNLDNLIVLPIKDHYKLHGKTNGYSHFGHGVPEYSRVLSIEKLGIEDTYDIEMKQPYDNYVANGIVVHNTGKTIQTILFIMHKGNKYRDKGIPQTLIFAPLSVLKQWRNEFELVSDEFLGEILVMDKNKTYTSKDLRKVVVVNYEKVNSAKYYAYLKSIKWDIIVLDESMRIKSMSAKSTKKIIALSDLNKDNLIGKYILSGTPNPSSYLDLWSQFRFLNYGLGDNYYAFRNRFFEDKNQAKKAFIPRYYSDWVLMKGSDALISGIIKPYTSVVNKEDCFDLPPLIKVTRFVELTSEQLSHYKSMYKHFITYINEQTCVANMALTKLIRLQQIVMGYVKTETGSSFNIPSNRQAILEEIVLELPSSSQFIIWSNYVETYAQISGVLEKQGISYGLYTGTCTAKTKQETLNKFKSGEIRCLIGNPASAGVGLNLQEANYMIYYQNSYSYMYDAQSEARCYRSGSERHNSVTRIDIVASNTIDEDIHKALKLKKDGLEYLINKLRG
jgi:hypothetical protein